MMNLPKISVVMSVYNSQRYIEKSIQSILAQSFKNFEFLIIDDGSIDATSEILDRCQKADNRIRIIKNRLNIGLSKSLNIGIREARGEYIARQDGDDISMSNRLEEQLNFMESNKTVSLLGTFYRMVSDEDKTLYRFNVPVQDSEIKEWLKKVNCFCHGSVMLRKQDVEESGLYPEQYEFSQDYALWLTMSKDHRLANIPKFLYVLRLHENARSVKDKIKQWECLFRIKKDKGIITNNYMLSNRFIADEFFKYGDFFNKMGIKKLSLRYFIKGVLYKSFIPSINFTIHKPIGVCMLTGVFYPEISGGGLQCRTLTEGLKHETKFKFFILTTTRDPLLKEHDSKLQITRVYVGDMGFTIKCIAALQFINIFLNIKNKIDIVHLHGFSNKTMLVILLARMFKKKIVQKVTSLGDDDPFSICKKGFGRLKKAFFSKSDIYISVNPAMSKRILDSGIPRHKLLTIPNGVDVERFCPPESLDEKNRLRDKLKLPRQALIILFVGFFSKDKGADILFEAYKNVTARFKDKDIRLLLIGSTDTGYFEIKSKIIDTIKQDIKACNLEARVLFLEKTLEIENYYKTSDIFVLPSFREGLPNALMEAMSAGMPCISSDLDGLAGYLFTHQVEGLFFKPGNIDGLSLALTRLIENPSLARGLGNKARENIINNFSIKEISKEYVKVYESLV